MADLLLWLEMRRWAIRRWWRARRNPAWDAPTTREWLALPAAPEPLALPAAPVAIDPVHVGATEEWSPIAEIGRDVDPFDAEVLALHRELEPAFAAAFAQFNGELNAVISALLRPIDGQASLDALGLGATGEYHQVEAGVG